MSLFDIAALSRLQDEFRRSMHRLLVGLCGELEARYADLAQTLNLPVTYVRLLSQGFSQTDYGNGKVVGWIESLNDLVYFLDLLQQIRRDRDREGFAEQLYAECEQQLFENSYLDELFPQGRPQRQGLELRIQNLCLRLARDITQESLFFDPRWAMRWSGRQGLQRWEVTGTLDQQLERAEQAFTLPIGTGGETLRVPTAIARTFGHGQPVQFEIVGHRIALKKKSELFPICSLRGSELEWHWPRQLPIEAGVTAAGPLTVGPTLQYDQHRQPKKVVPTSTERVARVARAWKAIRQAWPEGHRLLGLFTSRIIPLKAKGVVSFSYRHRPGLSFVNCFERGNLDLIDDLIHENSHHHLNLLLRKHVMYHGDRNQQIFYSPWRRSLRPVRGILHATFTFTMGALLFERLSAWAETTQGAKEWKAAGLTRRDLLRARFRCLEEIESVRYSIQDLDYAGRHLKWITGSGARLVRQLEEEITDAEQRIARHRNAVLASSFGPALRKHIKELEEARRTYGLARLRKA